MQTFPPYTLNADSKEVCTSPRQTERSLLAESRPDPFALLSANTYASAIKHQQETCLNGPGVYLSGTADGRAACMPAKGGHSDASGYSRAAAHNALHQPRRRLSHAPVLKLNSRP